MYSLDKLWHTLGYAESIVGGFYLFICSYGDKLWAIPAHMYFCSYSDKLWAIPARMYFCSYGDKVWAIPARM